MKNGNTMFTTVLFMLTCLTLSPRAQAVSPAPDGGYPGFTTAEGQNALLHLTTGRFNTAVGWFSLESVTTGSFNTGVGAGTLVLNSGDQNTATGAAALLLNTTGSFNTANGALALFNNTTGAANAATGDSALISNTTGSTNTANGDGALFGNTTGSGNIALGSFAGSDLTTGDLNIDIGNFGVAGEGNTIRIGRDVHTRTFIAAIRGVTTQNADAIPVLIDSAGQLGTMSSSRRFKKEIKPMDKASESIMALKPVTFHYKSDKTDTPQFGLIAEEVAAVNPDLVVRDKNGEIYTVRYDAVNAMLLNEFLKEHRKVEEQQAAITELKSTVSNQLETIAKHEQTIADLKKAMGVLTVQFKEQAAQIQKVGDQLAAASPSRGGLEMSKTTPNVVFNNP